MTARTAQARASWQAALRTAQVPTAERLVGEQLPAFLATKTGAHVDLAELAASCCLPVPVVTAALATLTARQLVHTRADGRLVLSTPGGAP